MAHEIQTPNDTIDSSLKGGMDGVPGKNHHELGVVVDYLNEVKTAESIGFE